MNKRSLTAARILTGASALLAVTFTVLRTHMLLTAYDFENGFYTDDTLHAVLRYSLIAFAAIAFAVGHIYIKEENRHVPLPEGKVFGAVSMLAGCVLAGFLVYTLGKAVLPMFETPAAADLVMALFAVVALLYYFTVGKKGDFRALLCSASALLLLIMVFGIYFNTEISYVNHSVILCYSAAIFTMLAFAAEANFALGRSAYKRYLSYAPVAVVLTLTQAIPDCIVALTHRIEILPDLFYDILLLTFGIYHLTRLVLIAAKKECAE